MQAKSFVVPRVDPVQQSEERKIAIHFSPYSRSSATVVNLTSHTEECRLLDHCQRLRAAGQLLTVNRRQAITVGKPPSDNRRQTTAVRQPPSVNRRKTAANAVG